MQLLFVTTIPLFGEALGGCFRRHPEISLQATVPDLPSMCKTLETTQTDIVLIDVTQGVDLDQVRAIAAEHPDVAFVALGLQERQQEVIRCGRAGFSGYVARNASVDELCSALFDVIAGRLACSSEISGSLLRALFRIVPQSGPEEALTRREGEVLHLIGRGSSNKEIARELGLSVSTVKHHVHHVLVKLGLPRRAQAMRRVREMPWLASAPALERLQKN
jgi:DNA-binding NarL/FixJ family response regulator